MTIVSSQNQPKHTHAQKIKIKHFNISSSQYFGYPANAELKLPILTVILNFVTNKCGVINFFDFQELRQVIGSNMKRPLIKSRKQQRLFIAFFTL